jgi:glycerophosphoryl diester phosphodiesterase
MRLALPRYIAHRCGGALAPENTLAGLQVAAACGYQAVEFDVMLSGDGTPVLIHDETLERTTNGIGPVCKTPDAVLFSLDAGQGEHIPTLVEAAAICQRHGLLANVEIKPATGFETRTGEAVARFVSEHWNSDVRPLLSSFSPEALEAAHRVAPQLQYGLLFEAVPADWLRFLKFFESKGHQIVASSSLVPGDDPTLLFTNAGMNQFKDVFLGFDKRPTTAPPPRRSACAPAASTTTWKTSATPRATTPSSRCWATSASATTSSATRSSYAWELLTEVFKLPKDKLWVTVYAEDDEAYDIWTKEIGVPAERIVRIGDNKGARYASDNFWMMGDTGPCGPCTEIFYDHGEHIPAARPGSARRRRRPLHRDLEQRLHAVQPRRSRCDAPLPKPSRRHRHGPGAHLAAVLQHVHSNYEIDLFQNLIKAAARETSGADLDSPR